MMAGRGCVLRGGGFLKDKADIENIGLIRKTGQNNPKEIKEFNRIRLYPV
jgi:hypothetical protein